MTVGYLVYLEDERDCDVCDCLKTPPIIFTCSDESQSKQSTQYFSVNEQLNANYFGE